MALNRERLDEIYHQWNRPEFISPDPLETLAPWRETADREVVALLAGTMAYGRVNSILNSLNRIIAVMGSSPGDYVTARSETDMEGDLEGIVHRFARPAHIAALLAGAGGVILRIGSLEAAFLSGYRQAGNSAGGEPVPGAPAAVLPVLAGLKSLETALREGAAGEPGHLLTDPARGSACKRLLLFLRWMVRRDAVDPGGWGSVSSADLLLPLDTWTYRIAKRAGWTSRGSADMKTVVEVTGALAGLNPQDPVRYDFALSRFGIRSGLNLDLLFEAE